MVAAPALWPTDLDSRRDRAQAALLDCRLCSRNCGVDRSVTANGSWCRLGPEAYAYKELLSHGEEACLSPTWLIDLSGCSLRCLFCTEWDAITRPLAAPAVPLQVGWFLRRLKQRRSAGARTLSFVGGEPTVNLAGVLAVLAAVPAELQLPIVWNTNGLIGAQAMALLAGLVRTWVVDLKVAAGPTARRLLGAADLDYGEAVRATLDAVHPRQDTEFTEADVSSSNPAKSPPTLVIRHLLMPDSLEDQTLPILHEIAARWPNAVVNLMTMYLPFGPALRQPNAPAELRGMVADSDRRRAIQTARDLRLNLLVDGR